MTCQASTASALGVERLPGELFEFGAGDWFGSTLPVAVDEGVPFVGYSACPPACSEEGAGDGGDGVGVVADPNGRRGCRSVGSSHGP